MRSYYSHVQCTTDRVGCAEAKTKWGWLACWRDAVAEPDTFYVKIDDDIVFIEVHRIDGRALLHIPHGPCIMCQGSHA